MIRFEGRPKELVVTDRDWDGSDIFTVRGLASGAFVTRKAKEWFERAHVVEVQFKGACSGDTILNY
jgi:hypothetical protein